MDTTTINNTATDWLRQQAAELNQDMARAAQAHQDQLTKPQGSLGQLETIVIRLAAHQGTLHPDLDQVAIRLFAADHGVVKQGVSAFPQSVTAQMVANFCSGGAAISVLARIAAADLVVVDMGVAERLPAHPQLLDYSVATGTKDFSSAAAMTDGQLQQSLAGGRKVIDNLPQPTSLFIGGEMGIGNTTSAAALACAALELPAEQLVGHGTGIDDNGWRRKVAAVTAGLQRYSKVSAEQTSATTPLTMLATLGGFEIAALCAAYIRCAQRGISCLVDGYITSVAALFACRINPSVRDWLFFAHCSAEPGHRAVLDALEAEPLLNLGMRLGEGSGAAAALPLMRLACSLHNDMATFSSAGVSEKHDE